MFLRCATVFRDTLPVCCGGHRFYLWGIQFEHYYYPASWIAPNRKRVPIRNRARIAVNSRVQIKHSDLVTKKKKKCINIIYVITNSYIERHTPIRARGGWRPLRSLFEFHGRFGHRGGHGRRHRGGHVELQLHGGRRTTGRGRRQVLRSFLPRAGCLAARHAQVGRFVLLVGRVSRVRFQFRSNGGGCLRGRRHLLT